MLEKLIKVIKKLLTGKSKKNDEISDIEKLLIKLAADGGYNAGKNLAFVDTMKYIDAYISMNRRKDEETAEEKTINDKFLKQGLSLRSFPSNFNISKN